MVGEGCDRGGGYITLRIVSTSSSYLSRRTTAWRRAAALLAIIALVAMPLRAVGACAMPAGEPGSAITAGGAGEPTADEHLHHATESEGGEVPTGSPHQVCPDLSGCAVVALGAAGVGHVSFGSGALPPERALVSLVDGPRSALDPPPPRR